MVQEKIRRINCEKCKLSTEHARIYASTMLVLWQGTYRRVDYGTSKYRCLKCGEVRTFSEERDLLEEPYPADNTKTPGVG